tara:strand:- start:1762 stop:1953 length:192 start_codon:yes stop_codon:yes gene_type:complete
MRIGHGWGRTRGPATGTPAMAVEKREASMTRGKPPGRSRDLFKPDECRNFFTAEYRCPWEPLN